MLRPYIPILLVTATVSGNLTMVFDALGHGALDVVQTPGFGRRGDDDGTVELRRKLVSVARLVSGPGERPRITPSPPAPFGVSGSGLPRPAATGRRSATAPACATSRGA